MSSTRTTWLRLDRVLVRRLYLVLLGITWVATGAGLILGQALADARALLLRDDILIGLGLLVATILSSLIYLFRWGCRQRVLPIVLLVLYAAAAGLVWADELPAATGLLALCLVLPVLWILVPRVVFPLLGNVRLWLGLLLVGIVVLVPALLTPLLPVWLMGSLRNFWFWSQFFQGYGWLLIRLATILLLGLVPFLLLLLKAESGPGARRDIAAGLLRRNRMAQRGFACVEALVFCVVVMILGTAAGALIPMVEVMLIR